MMGKHRRWLPALATICVAAALVRAAPQANTIRITSPAEGTFLIGAVRFTVAFDPAPLIHQIQHLRWFADGKQVCTSSVPPYSCEWDAGEKINEHLIRAVATLRNGERLTANSRTRAVEFAEAVDVDVIQITAVVTDSDGRFVSGLKAADFKVFDDDKPQAITNFASEDIPLELVAALDVSSSMQDALPAVKRQATDFLAQLRRADQVTVLGFNDTIFTPARRSTDQAVRAKAIGRLAPWGGTALYDAIIHALDLLGRQSGRRALVVFSDGEDQSSRAPMASVIKRAEASDATIYMIGQGRALRVSALQQLMSSWPPAAADARSFRTRTRSSTRSSGRSSRTFVISTCSATPRPTTRGAANCTGSGSKFPGAGITCAPGRITGCPAANRSRLTASVSWVRLLISALLISVAVPAAAQPQLFVGTTDTLFSDRGSVTIVDGKPSTQSEGSGFRRASGPRPSHSV